MTADQMLVDARRTWPQIAVPDEVFVVAVSAREASHRLHGADLYLALGCLRRDAYAIAAFDALVAAAIEHPVRAILGSAADIDDIRQRVCERLLVAGDRVTPGLANYNPSVGLAGYVRVVAARMAIDERRQRARLFPLEDTLVDALGSYPDPRLAELKSRYVEQFKAAVEGAIAKLRDAMHVVDSPDLDGCKAAVSSPADNSSSPPRRSMAARAAPTSASKSLVRPSWWAIHSRSIFARAARSSSRPASAAQIAV
jgi:DNA-directed RNA polymerase specialized sigma24 family protein